MSVFQREDINNEMRKFFPSERLEYLKEFFSARLDNSYMIAASIAPLLDCV
mgnify:CR=1 FL=1